MPVAKRLRVAVAGGTPDDVLPADFFQRFGALCEWNKAGLLSEAEFAIANTKLGLCWGTTVPACQFNGCMNGALN